MSFVHLHVHTQYSILDGQSSIENLFARAHELGMPGLSITDHGNMYGVKEFYKYAKKYPDIKPIIGCEVYVSKFDHKIKDKDHRAYYHLILLAKNYAGYKNLMKIVSTGHIEGMYYRPRVSHEVLEKYHENLICSSACLAGELSRKIMAGDLEAAEEALQWHKKVFGDDYYLEVMLHKTEIPGQSQEVFEKQSIVNDALFSMAEKYGVKVIATNDVHFVRKEDGPVHDRLICLTTNEYVDSPDRLRYTQQEFLKSEDEMLALFPCHPEVVSNTMEIFDKVERYEIDRPHVLPKFQIEDSFLKDIDKYLEKYKDIIDAGRVDEKGNDRGVEFTHSVAYLSHLSYEGARTRYPDMSEDTAQRMDFELKTISRMGFPDYFLIVQDYIAAARNRGIFVGPGRGSAAGSVVAYCLGITNLDPVKYDLLFERFLNPERISMPDIDVDFDDEGRYAVIQYVQERYGKDHVSHVITFGTMAAKGSIKDVARISHLSIDDSNRLTKMIPDRGVSVKKEIPFDENYVLKDGEKVEKKNGNKIIVTNQEKEIKPTLANCIKFSDVLGTQALKDEFDNGTDLVKEVLRYALKLEGTIRQVGIHACAMIIGPGDLTDYIPMTVGTDKASGQEVWMSQYEGSFIEDVGMLKMDFLGLKTLSIIKECLSNIKKSHGIDIDIEKIPNDDPATYELYSRGDTKSIFQFESPGMKEWLQKLHPERFEDLIAMNALYRPGPMDYIPAFVARKRGEENIVYDLDDMGEYLEETYGVTVYQEQVMLISQKIAGFSKGKADKLRKAMGKKKIDILQSMHEEFINGGTGHGHPKEILDKIWKDWEKFASYAFNKSHATCYAWVSYQTGWLKAHYLAEFQAANLSQQLGNMTEIQEIMDDCKKHKIKVLNPDVNESEAHFTVNKEGSIRFGLGGMKGFGENLVKAIVDDRRANGLFKDIYNFEERLGAIINRKAFETLLYAGAFDGFGNRRGQFLQACSNGEIFLDELTKYADLYKNDTMDASSSLFGEVEEMKPVRPEMPALTVEENTLDLLQKEKEMVGMYLSSHPLDQYAFEIKTFTNCDLSKLPDLITTCEMQKKSVKVMVAGLVTSFKPFTTKSGQPCSKSTIEDYLGSYEVALFGKDHEAFMSYFQVIHTALLIEGEVKERYHLKPEEAAQGKTAPYGFKIKKITLLGNVASTMIHNFTIEITTPMLSDTFRKSLISVIRANQGNIPLNMKLYDPEKGYTIDFVSNKFKVAVNTGFVDQLKELDIKYVVS